MIILLFYLMSYSYSQCDANDDGDLDVLDVVIEVECILANCWESDIIENCTDYDGNIYGIVQIGDQLWMSENLKVTHYNNGDEIPNITNNSNWGSLSIGAYGDISNNPTNSDTYGRLYNWYAVDDERGICPDGFHVPSVDDFRQLEMYLGMSESWAMTSGWRGTNEGSKLAGSSDLWIDGNDYDCPGYCEGNGSSCLENNIEFGTSGFNALPAGWRMNNGYCSGSNSSAYFWLSTGSHIYNSAYYRQLSYLHSEVKSSTFSNLGYGLSVRCVGD